MDTKPEERWFDSGTHMLRYGLRRGSGVPLVLVHEMGGSLESWDLVLKHIAPGRSVVVAEMRGMGRSERLPAAKSFADLAADLAALLDALGFDNQVVLSGCAVGAAVALRLVCDQPERVAGCLALDPALNTAPERRQATLDLADRMEAQGMRAVEGDLLSRTYPKLYRDRAPAHFETIRARWLANDPAAFASYLRVLADTDMIPDLARITRPVCFGAGINDVLRPPEYVRAVAAEIPGAWVVELDAGHHVPDHAPKAVADLLQAL